MSCVSEFAVEANARRVTQKRQRAVSLAKRGVYEGGQRKKKVICVEEDGDCGNPIWEIICSKPRGERGMSLPGGLSDLEPVIRRGSGHDFFHYNYYYYYYCFYDYYHDSV